MSKRSKHQRLMATVRYVDGKTQGYTYSVESRDEACQRISERSSKQALAQNKSIKCNLSEEKKRIIRNTQWKIGKIQMAIDSARESLSNHISYKIVLRAEQQKESQSRLSETGSFDSQLTSTCCDDSKNIFGVYGSSCYEKLLPEIEMVKSLTFNGCKRRQLYNKMLLEKRSRMPCLDRTLSNSQFFSIAQKLVDDEKNIANEQQKYKPIKCTRLSDSASENLSTSKSDDIMHELKLPAIS